MSEYVKPTGDPPDKRIASEAVAAAVAAALATELAKPLAPGLHLVATPIGNLADTSLRAVAVLARADLVYCEDPRHSLKLLNHFGLRRPLGAYHEHNGERERPKILAALQAGRSVALISDAGTPLISDPGFKLVRAVQAASLPVTAVPGPCAAIAALSIAGLPTDSFQFEGFLPAKTVARRARIEELAALPATLILYEAPQRLAETLRDLAAGFGGREAVVARELTKLHEEVRRGALIALAEWAAANPPKGEIVILVGPPSITEASEDEIVARLRTALASMSLRDAVREVVAATRTARSRVYEIGLKLKRTSGEDEK